jgi:hypothetical protein
MESKSLSSDWINVKAGLQSANYTKGSLAKYERVNYGGFDPDASYLSDTEKI